MFGHRSDVTRLHPLPHPTLLAPSDLLEIHYQLHYLRTDVKMIKRTCLNALQPANTNSTKMTIKRRSMRKWCVSFTHVSEEQCHKYWSELGHLSASAESFHDQNWFPISCLCRSTPFNPSYVLYVSKHIFKSTPLLHLASPAQLFLLLARPRALLGSLLDLVWGAALCSQTPEEESSLKQGLV